MKEAGGPAKVFEVPNIIGKGTAWRIQEPDTTLTVWACPPTQPAKCSKESVSFTCLLCNETPHYFVKVRALPWTLRLAFHMTL